MSLGLFRRQSAGALGGPATQREQPSLASSSVDARSKAQPPLSCCSCLSSEGALFACLSCFENLTNSVSVAVFSSAYAATVAWFPGFIFLMSAGLCVVPLFVLG